MIPDRPLTLKILSGCGVYDGSEIHEASAYVDTVKLSPLPVVAVTPCLWPPS